MDVFSNERVIEQNIDCHTLVIGAGSAGIEAIKAASEQGAECVLVDCGHGGTTAQRAGELPVGLLMSAAQAMHAYETLEEHGITVSEQTKPDTSRVLSSLRAIRARATSEFVSFLYRIPEEKRLRGKACFADDHTVIVNGTTAVHFETAVIATGSSPLITFEQSRLKHILTSNEFFDLESLPKSVAVFGSSKVGLQLGQALSYLGVDVTVFGQKKLWRFTDSGVLNTAINLLSSKFNLCVNTYVTSLEEDADNSGYDIYYMDENSYENFLHMDSVVAATDRVPNVGGMMLSNIGVKIKPDGYIRVNEDSMQTTLPHIFAAGDVCNSYFLSSVAISEGRIAGYNAARYPEISYRNKQSILNIVYTDPILAIVGKSFDDMRRYAKTSGDNFLVSSVHLNLGQIRGLRENGGVLSMYTSVTTHKIMGAELCAYKGDKIANFLALAIDNGYTVERLATYSFPHLSSEAVIGSAAKIALDKLKRTGKYKKPLSPTSVI